MVVMTYLRILFTTLLLVLFTSKAGAQKVGLVLSGGGASGMCHIGVIKALEDNHIPIDYITGTSIGALVGAYYAAGYSPAEIERIVDTYFFRSITRGSLPVKFEYMLKKRDDYAGWITLKYDFNGNYLKNLPTNVINSVPIDYYLMETFATVATRRGNNFDSLMVPYRCLASDIQAQAPVVFKEGDLPSAIRASISYPFYLRPINVDGRLLFDGGLYNNFPSDVMLKDFNPDYIIGSNVAEKNSVPDEDNLYLQLRSLLMSPTNFTPACENGVIIEPWSDVTLFNFENAKRLIDSGYAATVRLLPTILAQTQRRSDSVSLSKKRLLYHNLQDPSQVKFTSLKISGLTPHQERFVRKSIFIGRDGITLNQLSKPYFRLASDDKLRNLFPVAKRDSSGNYQLTIQAKKEKPFYVEPGALISNRPILGAFLGIQYNHLGKIGYSFYANGYLGKLHSSTLFKMRFDVPGKIPVFFEPSFTYSRWDYFGSSVVFYDFQRPAYLIQEDQFGELKMGLPVGNISQVNLAAGITQWKNSYYQNDNYQKFDTTDITYFDYRYMQANYTINTLNRKMYATEGTLLNARARYLFGNESYVPGNTGVDTSSFKNVARTPWLQLKLTFDSYIRTFKYFKLGVFAEGVYSTQSFFSNYKSTILSAPAFNPTPESKTFFIDAYRAHKYVAAGLKLISSPLKSVDIRLEAYIFQPIEAIKSDEFGKAYYAAPFLYQYFSGLAALVYNSPLGPISVGVNYYDQNDVAFSPFFHMGFIIFNKKSID